MLARATGETDLVMMKVKMVLTEGMVPYTNRDFKERLKDLWERFENEH